MNAREWFYGPLGFGSTSGSFPVTGATVRKTDVAMARTEKGLCVRCAEPMDPERESLWCAKCEEA